MQRPWPRRTRPRKPRAIGRDDSPSPWRSRPPIAAVGTGGPSEQARGSPPSSHRHAPTTPRCSSVGPPRSRWESLCGSTPMITWSSLSVPSWKGRPRSACRLRAPAHGPPRSVEPDRSRSLTGWHTLGEPTRRRQAVHEPTRPTTYSARGRYEPKPSPPVHHIQVGGSLPDDGLVMDGRSHEPGRGWGSG